MKYYLFTTYYISEDQEKALNTLGLAKNQIDFLKSDYYDIKQWFIEIIAKIKYIFSNKTIDGENNAYLNIKQKNDFFNM